MFRAMERPTTEASLRSHLRSHNATVLTASGIALVCSVIGWALLYGGAYWFTMLSLSIARADEGGMPAAFHRVYFGTMAILLLAAWVDQFLFPEERAVDERPPLEHLADILFFVPRFTLSCWQSLAALVRFSTTEMAHATAILDLLRSGEKVTLQSLPAHFPDAKRLGRVLRGLGMANLVDQRRDDSVTWLRLSPLAPENFRPTGAPRGDGGDGFANIPRARAAAPRRALPPSD